MSDPFGLLPSSGLFAAELLAERLREASDEAAASILEAQVTWLRGGAPSLLAEVVRRTAAVLDPKTGRGGYPRVGTAGVFDLNVGHLGREMWLYDDPETLWDAPPDGSDDGVIAMLAEAIRQGRYPTGVRLMLFEGASRLHAALRRYGLARVVTHLELRLAGDLKEPDVARRYPGLRGLRVDHVHLPAILSESLPELRSLVLNGSVTPDSLALAMRRAPKLAHLGVWHAGERGWWLDALLEHAERLETLQLFDVNHARGFPFAELAHHRDRWAHLKLLALPGHLVPDGERERFAHDPQVVFVGFDRREMVALDLETHGWPHGV